MTYLLIFVNCGTMAVAAFKRVVFPDWSGPTMITGSCDRMVLRR